MKLFLGVILTAIGIFFCILYLSLMDMGYSFVQYGYFIIKRWECLLIIVGLVLIVLDGYERRKKR